MGGCQLNVEDSELPKLKLLNKLLNKPLVRNTMTILYWHDSSISVLYNLSIPERKKQEQIIYL